MEPKKDLTKAILDKSTSSKSEPHGKPQGGAGSQGVISASGTAARTRTPVQEKEPAEEEEAARDLHEAEHGEQWIDEEMGRLEKV